MVTKYWFWLAILSTAVLILERLFPWRKEQRLFRPQLAQDFFWLVFNGYLWGVVVSWVYRVVPVGGGMTWAGAVTGLRSRFHLSWDLTLQVVTVLVVTDFIEWCVHNLLHRVGPLWKIHRVHHSIKVMDWIGNFRFHWGEHIVYRSIKFFPLVFLGVRWEAALIAAVIATAIGHLNHSNLAISWGPLRYVLNSPRMHIWHHDKFPGRPSGYNFGIVFSVWDWLFGTAYMPETQPAEIGFNNEQRVPQSLISRFFVPWVNR